MSPFDVLTALKQRNILSPGQADALADFEQKRPVSVHHELRAALYVGILLLASGLGLLIYEHYDEIGDLAIVGGMVGLCAVAFLYAWKNRPPLSTEQARNRSVFGDYALLLACLLFLSLEGYVQYRFNLFGTRYGLVTFLPAVLFIGLAYRFDHRGVLGMGLTALASWVGVTVRPLELRLRTNFFDEPTVLAAIGLGTLLIGAALWLERKPIKAHFTYTILTFAGNLLLLALLAGVFNFDGRRLFYAIPLFGVCAAFDWLARREQVFLYRLMGVVYGYIGITYLLFFQILDGMHYPTEVYLIYFIATGAGAVFYLTHSYRKRS
ncbi:DUF2157 domain-containing protein [Fibrivirga algicola]|uniref:DUF2157 domain-containing protein n=1 Tax=Fibrivirga algicola TaxID=2950420 RepID=A0ABX0QEE1_9BACT|nr:DUF2157 domain-containing protein [Fibrivirga algicola]ARK09396.1 hypothetical protein A6C57_03100 [Fibrella sp. ES10-3-2-2]NID10268.1 DUF2157 domain-containing protein [Fibrivirga algicola]